MAEEFERETVLPISIAQGDEIAPLGRAGIGDDDVDPAKLRDRGLDEGRGSSRLAQIRHMSKRAHAGSGDLGDARPQLVAAARSERDGATGAGKLARDLGPDTAAGAGDQCHLVRQSHLHLVIPPAQTIGSRYWGLALTFAATTAQATLTANRACSQAGRERCAGTCPYLRSW
jgi:hypothetical protein